jgi:hypothetical protein
MTKKNCEKAGGTIKDGYCAIEKTQLQKNFKLKEAKTEKKTVKRGM